VSAHPRKDFMKVVFQKADLDTCLTALICGVTPVNEISFAPQGASPQDLADLSVVCIEAGGSGQISLKNFDHHHPEQPELLPACVQAFAMCGGEQKMKRLVDYVSAVDTDLKALLIRLAPGDTPPHPTLSYLFSGMRLTVKNPVQQFQRGIELLKLILDEGIDPFGAMPMRLEWSVYLKAKEADVLALEEVKNGAQFFNSESGLKVGYLETQNFKALGALYKLGCDVAIAYNPRYGNPPIRKFTIGSCREDVTLDRLLEVLNKVEPGWGGHERIIGSPLGEGSALLTTQTVRIVVDVL